MFDPQDFQSFTSEPVKNQVILKAIDAPGANVLQASHAEFPQSPFSFRSTNRPPAVPPRWEWEPGRVNPERDLKWYEFVLVHAGPGVIAVSSNFSRVVQNGTWSLWRQSSFGGRER